MKDLYEHGCFSISFSGRLNRKRYFLGSLCVGLAVLIAYTILEAVGALGDEFGEASLFGSLIALVLYVFVTIYGLSMAVRRLHDLDKSGWLSLIVLVPLANAVFYLWILFAAGTAGPNKYGPDPLEGGK